MTAHSSNKLWVYNFLTVIIVIVIIISSSSNSIVVVVVINNGFIISCIVNDMINFTYMYILKNQLKG